MPILVLSTSSPLISDYNCLSHQGAFSTFSNRIARPSMLADKANLVELSIFNPTFIDFDKTSSYLSVQFFSIFSDFQWPESIGKHRINPVSSVKTTESWEVSLGTISQQTSFDSVIPRHHYGIIRQDYGIIQVFPTWSQFTGSN